MTSKNSLNRVTTNVFMFFPRDLIMFCSCLQGSPTLSSTSVFTSNNPTWRHHELPTPKLSAPLQPTAVPYAQLSLYPLYNPPAPPYPPLSISKIETQVCVSTQFDGVWISFHPVLQYAKVVYARRIISHTQSSFRGGKTYLSS